MAKKQGKTQAERKPKGASGRNGQVPPPEHRWKPGQSGNPKGMKPGTTSLTARLRRIVEENDGQVGEALVKVAIREAAKGNWKFWNSIMERLDGKVVDRMDVTSKGESIKAFIDIRTEDV